MRTALLFALMVLAATSNAQTIFPQSLGYNQYRSGFANQLPVSDSGIQKKWFLTRYSALSTSYSFYKGGHATVVAAPIGLQLNRKLNDHLYAFANATIAPAYVNFSRSLMTTNLSKWPANNFLSKSGSLSLYSSASLGLMYVNTEKTFSISGSISVERSNYPLLPYYYSNNQRPTNTNTLIR